MTTTILSEQFKKCFNNKELCIPFPLRVHKPIVRSLFLRKYASNTNKQSGRRKTIFVIYQWFRSLPSWTQLLDCDMCPSFQFVSLGSVATKPYPHYNLTDFYVRRRSYSECRGESDLFKSRRKRHNINSVGIQWYRNRKRKICIILLWSSFYSHDLLQLLAKWHL